MNNEQLWQWFLANRQNMDNAGLNSLADAYQWGRHGNPAAMRVRLAGQLHQLAQQDPTRQALWNPPGQPVTAPAPAVAAPASTAPATPAATPTLAPTGGPVVTPTTGGGAPAPTPPTTKARTDYDPDPAIARAQVHAEHSLGTINADNARDLLVELDREVAAAAAGTPPAPAPAAPTVPPIRDRSAYHADPGIARAEVINDFVHGTISGTNYSVLIGMLDAEIAAATPRRRRVLGFIPVFWEAPTTPAPGAATAAPPAPAAAGATAEVHMRDGGWGLGWLAAATLAVLAFLFLFWPGLGGKPFWDWDFGNGSSVTNVANNPGNPVGGNPTNGGGGTTPPKVIAGETDSDKNGIADETRRDLGMTPGDGVCPTDDQVQAALGGLTVHWISGCLFKWNSNGVDFVTRTCPEGYYCTLDMGAENVAWKGGGEKYRFEGGSFWPLAEKTFSDQCVYLRHENVYAGIVGDPPTLAGNFSCDGAKPATSGATTTSASTGGSSATQTTNGCLVNSSADAARLIGGDAGNWTQLEPGVFKYRNKGTYTAGFKHPGGTGRLDYWGNNKSESLTSSGEVPYPQDEMTFHCS